MTEQQLAAVKQALKDAKWLDNWMGEKPLIECNKRVQSILAALRQAIATEESATQEPVAWMHKQGNHEEPSFRQLDDWEISNGWTQYPLYIHPQPKREPLTEWKPIQTAPKDMEVLLYCNKFIPLYIGKKRYGGLGEPQQDEFEWRCSSSGRFANPTYWMPLPKPPIEAAHGIKEQE